MKTKHINKSHPQCTCSLKAHVSLHSSPSLLRHYLHCESMSHMWYYCGYDNVCVSYTKFNLCCWLSMLMCTLASLHSECYNSIGGWIIVYVHIIYTWCVEFQCLNFFQVGELMYHKVTCDHKVACDHNEGECICWITKSVRYPFHT